jgi:dolichyl-phosphate-mannose-protein mannosyltransferase
MEKRTEKIFLLIILVSAAVLRVYNYGSFSLSNDELSALARLRFDSFSEMIEKGVMIDFHPAGVQIFLFCWIKIFGISESALRLPFVFLGIGSVWLIYLVGKKWFNSAVGLFAAASLCVLEFPLLYSQIARPYSPGLFFTLLSTYFWSEIFIGKIKNDPAITGKKPGIVSYTGFIFSVSACMYTHYFAMLQAGLMCIAGLFFLSKENYKAYFISGCIILLLYCPHLKIFLHQMSVGGIGGEQGWLSKPEYDFFGRYILYAFNNSTLLLFFFMFIFLATLIIFRSVRDKNKFRLLSFLFFIIPFLTGYFYSILRNPVLQYSVLLFSFSFLILFIFSFVIKTVQAKTVIALVTILLVFGTFSTAWQNKYYSTKHFGVFRELAEKTIAFNDKYGEQNITRTINIINPYYIDYYFSKFKREINFSQYVCNDYALVNDFVKIVDQSQTLYFIHAWSNTYDPPELEDVILESYPYLLSKNDFFNSGIRLYSKNSEGALTTGKPDYELLHDFESVKWGNDSLFFNDSIFHSGKQSAFMNEKNEYGPTFTLPVKNIELRKGDTIKISLYIYPLKEQESAKLVFSMDENDKSKVWLGREFRIYQTKINQWQQVFLAYIVDADLSGNEILKSYIWNDKKESFYLDDFKIRVFKQHFQN